MWFILYSNLLCHHFNPMKILHELLIVQYSVLNAPKCVFVWHLCSHCLAEWWVKTVVQRIFKSRGNSETKTIYATWEADIIFNQIMWYWETCPLFSQDLHSSDTGVSLPIHTVVWLVFYTVCFTRCVSGYQDGSSLEKHLRGTTGWGWLEYIYKKKKKSNTISSEMYSIHFMLESHLTV